MNRIFLVQLFFFLVTSAQAQNQPITKSEFEAVIESVARIYYPVAQKYNAKLRVDFDWNDMRSEAHAGKNGDDWFIYVAGGVARSSKMNLDGLAFVVCHELGHQFGGYPFVNLPPGNIWNTVEGQTDYYAAFVCARSIWKSDINENRKVVASIDPIAKQKCDQSWKTSNDRYLCYRITTAGKVMLENVASEYNFPYPNYSSTEEKKEMTLQCRLDSVLQGALCNAPYDFYAIPGFRHPDGINSPGAKEEAQKSSCDLKYGFKNGLKPTCWWPQ